MDTIITYILSRLDEMKEKQNSLYQADSEIWASLGDMQEEIETLQKNNKELNESLIMAELTVEGMQKLTEELQTENKVLKGCVNALTENHNTLYKRVQKLQKVAHEHSDPMVPQRYPTPTEEAN